MWLAALQPRADGAEIEQAAKNISFLYAQVRETARKTGHVSVEVSTPLSLRLGVYTKKSGPVNTTI